MTVGEIVILAKELCGSAFVQWDKGVDVAHAWFACEIDNLRTRLAASEASEKCLLSDVARLRKHVEEYYTDAKDEALSHDETGKDKHDGEHENCGVCDIFRAITSTTSSADGWEKMKREIRAEAFRDAAKMVKHNAGDWGSLSVAADLERMAQAEEVAGI